MQVYSFNEITALINGTQVEDWSEGDDVLVCERLNDAVSHTVGASGEMTINVSPDQSGTVTLKLKQTSPTNVLLGGLAQAAQNGAFTPITFFMKDNQREDLVTGTVGYIQNLAPLTRGASSNDSEWVLVFEKLFMKNGDITVSGIGALLGGIAGSLIGGAFGD